MAFRAGNREEVRTVQSELNTSIKEAKGNYRRKPEYKLRWNNAREGWRGMKTITSFRTTSSSGGEACDHQLPSVPSLLFTVLVSGTQE